MEIINLAQFMAYFGSWYPIIIPVTVVGVTLVALVLDWIRCWIIGYADDFENGPYKKYVVPLLERIFSVTHDKNVIDALSVLKDGRVSTYTGDFRKGGDAFRAEVNQYDKYLYIYPTATAEQVNAFHYLRNVLSDKQLWNVRLNWELPSSAEISRNFSMYVFVLGLVLTAYKFLPEVTVGCVIGYCVLRVARSTVRIGKKLKAHITDPNAHKETEANGKG